MRLKQRQRYLAGTKALLHRANVSILKNGRAVQKNDIQIVFTTVTQDPRTVAQYAEKFAQADSYIRNLAQKLNVEYYNFNYLTFEAFDREEGDFWDREGHMYGDTAKRFTKVYAEVLKKALAGSLKKSDYFGEDLKEIYKDVVPYE